jgi:hypothetical protein
MGPGDTRHPEYCTCLGHLGSPDTNWIIPICAVLPKVAKVASVIAVFYASVN